MLMVSLKTLKKWSQNKYRNILDNAFYLVCLWNPKLTDVGRQMAAYPLDPAMSKVIISAKDYGCMWVFNQSLLHINMVDLQKYSLMHCVWPDVVSSSSTCDGFFLCSFVKEIRFTSKLQWYSKTNVAGWKGLRHCLQ